MKHNLDNISIFLLMVVFVLFLYWLNLDIVKQRQKIEVLEKKVQTITDAFWVE